MATTSRTSVIAAARMTKRRIWSPKFLGAACASTRWTAATTAIW